MNEALSGDNDQAHPEQMPDNPSATRQDEENTHTANTDTTHTHEAPTNQHATSNELGDSPDTETKIDELNITTGFLHMIHKDSALKMENASHNPEMQRNAIDPIMNDKDPIDTKGDGHTDDAPQTNAPRGTTPHAPGPHRPDTTPDSTLVQTATTPQGPTQAPRVQPILETQHDDHNPRRHETLCPQPTLRLA